MCEAVHGATWEWISGDTGDQANRKSLIPGDTRLEATAAAAASSTGSGNVQMKGDGSMLRWKRVGTERSKWEGKRKSWQVSRKKDPSAFFWWPAAADGATKC